MNAIDQSLASAVERECNILQFREDHEEKNERLDEVMLREAKQARQRIKRIRKAAADEVTVIDAEERRIAKCRAYLTAGE